MTFHTLSSRRKPGSIVVQGSDYGASLNLCCEVFAR
jgi:hypothetical protein